LVLNTVAATVTKSITAITKQATRFGTTLNTGTAADTADPNNNGIPNLTDPSHPHRFMRLKIASTNS